MRYWPSLFRQDDQTIAKFIFHVSLDQDEELAMPYFFVNFLRDWEGSKYRNLYSPIRDKTRKFYSYFLFHMKSDLSTVFFLCYS